MGKGAGITFDVNFIMRLVAVIGCAVSVGLNVATMTKDQFIRWYLVSNSMIYAAGAYLIILGFFFCYGIFKEDPDTKLAAIVLLCGALWCIGGGVGVIIYSIDYDLGKTQLIGGILELAAGVVMFVDSLHNFGLF